MASTIGKWNPAWGPEPEWQGAQRRRSPTLTHCAWHLVECPRKSCPNAGKGPWLIYCPTASDSNKYPERYHCAACGAEMAQRAVTRAVKPKGKKRT